MAHCCSFVTWLVVGFATSESHEPLRELPSSGPYSNSKHTHRVVKRPNSEIERCPDPELAKRQIAMANCCSFGVWFVVRFATSESHESLSQLHWSAPYSNSKHPHRVVKRSNLEIGRCPDLELVKPQIAVANCCTFCAWFVVPFATLESRESLS